MKIEIKYHSTAPVFTEATDEEMSHLPTALTERDDNGNLKTQFIFFGGFPYSPVGIQYIRPVTEDGAND